MPITERNRRSKPSGSARTRTPAVPSRLPEVSLSVGQDGQPSRPVRRADVDRLQRLVGNQATMRILSGMRPTAIQRNGDGDKPPPKTESQPSLGEDISKTEQDLLKGPVKGVGNFTEKVGQGLDKGLQVSGGQGVEGFGTGVMLAMSFGNTVVHLVDLGTAVHQAMTPKTEEEHRQALDKAGNAVKSLHDEAWETTKSTSSFVGLLDPTAKIGTLGVGTLTSVAAVPAAYMSVATNLVGTAEKVMRLNELEDIQFNLWSDPNAALAKAEAEIRAADEAVTDNRATLQAAGELTKKQLAAHDEVSLMLTKLEVERNKARASPMGRMAERHSDMPTVDEAFSNDIERWTAYEKDSKAAYEQAVLAKKKAQVSYDTSVAFQKAALEKKEKREAFKNAVDAWAKEQESSGQKTNANPEKRYVPIEEIWHYAMGRVKVGVGRKGVATAAAVIGLVGGLVTLALGWTPVGWALAATAGAIALGLVGWKLGKSLLRKTGILGRSEREIYAERLWQYARDGYDPLGPGKPDPEVRRNQRANALSLLKALGLSWSIEDVDRTTNEKAAISKIAEKLKAG